MPREGATRVGRRSLLRRRRPLDGIVGQKLWAELLEPLRPAGGTEGSALGPGGCRSSNDRAASLVSRGAASTAGVEWNGVLASPLPRALNTPSACDERSEERSVGLGPWLRKEIIRERDNADGALRFLRGSDQELRALEDRDRDLDVPARSEMFGQVLFASHMPDRPVACAF